MENLKKNPRKIFGVLELFDFIQKVLDVLSDEIKPYKIKYSTCYKMNSKLQQNIIKSLLTFSKFCGTSYAVL